MGAVRDATSVNESARVRDFLVKVTVAMLEGAQAGEALKGERIANSAEFFLASLDLYPGKESSATEAL
jgi:hypothetical protein